VQSQGSFGDGGLATLLQSMKAERATGTLTIENGGDKCSLYLLFGHLFHADGSAGQGEEVVIDALGWDDGSYQFSRRGKLPAKETIKASPAELIAMAANRRSSQAAASTGAPMPPHEPWPGWEPLPPPPSLLTDASPGLGEEQQRGDRRTRSRAGESHPETP
jgi:hypothetical protein